MWTLVDDINDQISVRAVLHVPTQQMEIRALIASLQKRLKGSPDANQPAARPVAPAGSPGAAEAVAEATTEG